MEIEKILEDDANFSAELPQAHVISASAGSGKTYTLTQRYIQLLLSNKIKADGIDTNNPANILAVTFTRNAAKEMKVRILEWLEKMALEPDSKEFKESLALLCDDPKTLSARASERMEYLLDNYGDFNVKTIDKFMTSVMRASSNELRVSPDQAITTSYDELIDAAIALIFSSLDKEITRAEIDDFLDKIPTSGNYKWNPIKDIRKLFGEFLSAQGKLSGVIKTDGKKLSGAINACFKSVLDISKDLAKEAPKYVTDETLSIIMEPLQDSTLDAHIGRYIDKYKTAAILDGTKVKKTNIQKVLTPKAAELLELLREEYAKLLVLRSEAHYAAYVRIFEKFRSRLEDIERTKTGTLHIQEVSKRLSEYIDEGSVPEIYFRLGDRIWHYLIDEFQDTDIIQWGNFRHLVEESLSKKGSLLVVGDLKQAIYMFRNADYRIMRGILDPSTCPPGTEYLSLDSLGSKVKSSVLPVNYRSDGIIVNYVEDLFKNRVPITEDITGLKSFVQSVEKEREAQGYVLEEKVEYGDETKNEVKERLLELMNGISGGPGLLERYEPRDILVLVRKHKYVAEVIEWLSSSGISVAASSSLDIRHRKAVGELIALLRFLDSPIDDLSLGQFISGDIFASVSGMKREQLEELMLLWRMEKAPVFYSWLKERPEFKDLWGRYFERIFSRAGYIGVYELLSEAMLLYKVFGNFPDEAQFLVKLLDAANALQLKGSGGVKDFLVQIDEENSEESHNLFSIKLPDYVNAVRVMTAHTSKGLGSPVVINIFFDDKDPIDPMYIVQEGNVIKLYHITKKEEASDKLKKIREMKSQDDTVQTHNLFYVVVTRAKYEMFVLFAEKRKMGTDGE